MSLGIQLAVATLLVCLNATIHAVGVVAITRMLRLDGDKLRAHRVDHSAVMLSVVMALALFALHIFEIWVFAAFYLAIGAIDQLEPALYFSASAYTTLGTPDPHFPHEWRLIGAIEGLVGFLLIGWSTGVFISDMNKLLRE
jgi:hypothetical protein